MGRHEETTKLLQEFIEAVEQTDWTSPFGMMNSFPDGCCSVASVALGHLLQDRGLGRWHIVNGSAGVMRNHDWLVSSDGWVVDATCHQFEFGIEPFVATRGPSPLAAHFPPKQIIELSEMNPSHLVVYRVVEVQMARFAEERERSIKNEGIA